uniref:lysozyme n=2 Tax=Lygus hesperus TaxID=30085 RepID=A0A146KSZ7_LYGHE
MSYIYLLYYVIPVMLPVAAVLLTTLASVWGRIFTACEFAAELSKPEHKVDFWQIPTWVCLAHHASGLDTRYSHPANYFGIFRIASHWCSRCGFNCSDLTDDDVSKDIDCAVNVVYKEHGGSQNRGFYSGWGDWYTDFCLDPWENLDRFDCKVEPVGFQINNQKNTLNNNLSSSSSSNYTTTNPAFLNSNSSYFWRDIFSITLLCSAYVCVIILAVYLYRSNLYERLLDF